MIIVNAEHDTRHHQYQTYAEDCYQKTRNWQKQVDSVSRFRSRSCTLDHQSNIRQLKQSIMQSNKLGGHWS